MDERNATVEIPNHLSLVDGGKFEIIITEVNVKGYGRIYVDTGEPITVTIYDNDCK